MTEAEWLSCDDPDSMLESAGGRVSPRKPRPFAAACFRWDWAAWTSRRERAAVLTAGRPVRGQLEIDRLANTNCHPSVNAAFGYFTSSASGISTRPSPRATSAACNSARHWSCAVSGSRTDFGSRTARSLYPFAGTDRELLAVEVRVFHLQGAPLGQSQPAPVQEPGQEPNRVPHP